MYLFHGEESFFIDRLVEEIQQNALSYTEKEFNQNIFYGKDAEPKNIMNACMQYPMMSDYRLIILKEAQYMKDIEELLPLIEKPANTTILVVAHKEKKLSQRSKLSKAFDANGVVFESKRLYENQIPAWIKSFSPTIGLNVSDSAAELMTTLLANDLSKIENELHKLKISNDGSKTIDIDKVRESIGLNREYSVFEFSSAVGDGYLPKAMQILSIFSNNPGPYPNVLIINAMFMHFTKVLICSENIKKSDVELGKIVGLNPMFVKDLRRAANLYSRQKLIEVFSILKEYDLKSKGLDSKNTPQLELIKEMILKIML